MLKKFKFLLVSLLAVFGVGLVTLTTSVQAAGLTLDKIGTSVTTGKTFTSWTYTDVNPTFEGMASAGSEVNILINTYSSKVTADEAGIWTFSPGGVLSGDHSISITSEGQTISFTLTIGNDSAAAADSSSSAEASATDSAEVSAETLPKTGGMGMTLTLLVFGVAVLGFGLMSWSNMKLTSLANNFESDQT